MYMQFEESGLIRNTEENERCMEEKKKGSAADQSNAEPNNNTNDAIPMSNLA